MFGKKRYDPRSAFDDRSLPEKPNSLSADKIEELEKRAMPLLKAALKDLRQKQPDLFRGDAAELVDKKSEK